MFVVSKDLLGGVQLVDASAIGSEPKQPGLVFMDRPDRIVAQAARVTWVVPIAGKGLRSRVESIESAAARAYPDQAPLVFEDRQDSVVTQALGIVGIVSVLDEGFLLPIPSIEASATGSNPQPSGTIPVRSAISPTSSRRSLRSFEQSCSSGWRRASALRSDRLLATSTNVRERTFARLATWTEENRGGG